MRSLTISTLVVFCFLQITACQSRQQRTIVKIDKKTVLEKVIGADVQFIDVRTPKEYQEGHIGHALNFNIKDSITFRKQISTLNKKEPVYLYCRKGGRSNKASQILKENGFEIIYDYTGGYNDWKVTE
ncbi:rhodanese-like domain-containing protein [Flagellimonas sp. 389]|uniref:rhodanese-like domain-containing protein n=1 Tax=Flagellimonas sp. 389 TaxID=2835862 RepID=UPI001BD5BD83|nr:rhodanese-like domain-containing protein [Flagellimonas sp. 389]MBS9462845.1 rhodanese-like domain-containing protein [Flagellimonas sp. 389]